VTGRKNTETLEKFLRRILHLIMSQDPHSRLPGYFDGIDALPLDQLISTVPATVMTITEQYDQCLHQGFPSAEALAFIDGHRQNMLAILGHDGVLDDTTSPGSLEELILTTVRREQPDTGSFKIDRKLAGSLVAEVREFVRKNPRNSMTALQISLQAGRQL